MSIDEKAKVIFTWQHLASGTLGVLFGGLVLAWHASNLITEMQSNISRLEERSRDQVSALQTEIGFLKEADERFQVIAASISALTERSRANEGRLIRIEELLMEGRRNGRSHDR